MSADQALQAVMMREHFAERRRGNFNYQCQVGLLISFAFIMLLVEQQVRVVRFNWDEPGLVWYRAAFSYLILLGLLPRIANSLRSRLAARRIDVALRWPGHVYLAAVLAGAVWLSFLDSARGDAASLILICLPVALMHSASARVFALLYGGSWLVLMAATTAFHEHLEAHQLRYLVIASVAMLVCLQVAIISERRRYEAFAARWQLGRANATMTSRSRQLKNANLALERRGAELEQANEKLTDSNRLLAETNRRLQEAVMTDALTKVANRRRLYETLDREFMRSRRYRGPLSLAVIDLDDFKAINETHGHLLADDVLAGFAESLTRHVRNVDLVARFGGEEFVVVMPDSAEEDARHMLDRIRDQISAGPIGATGVVVTFSAGVAALEAGDEDSTPLLRRADQRLLRAKAAGKNRVISALG